MEKAREATAKGLGYWFKALMLFIGRSLLFVLGILFLFFIIVDHFEASLKLWEISVSEAAFWLTLVHISVRHYRRCRLSGLGLSSCLYRPIRNIGWLFVISIAITGGLVMVIGEGDWAYLQVIFEESLNPVTRFLDELVTMLATLACIFWASPSPIASVSVESGLETAV